MITPFELIYSEYKDLHPHRTFRTIIAEVSTPQRWLLALYFVALLLYVVCLFQKCIAGSVVSFLILILAASKLIKLIKKSSKPREINSYRKNAITPLRNTLQKYRLYNLPSIDFLIGKGEQKAKEATSLEKYVQLSKSLFSHVFSYFLIISIILILAQIGIGDIGTLEPSMDGVVSFVFSFFTIDYKLGILVVITIACIILSLSVFHYMLSSIFNDLNSRRRNEISNLVDDLKFIRIDFSDKHEKKPRALSNATCTR